MAKIKPVEENMYRFHCPGCGCSHVFTCNGRKYPNVDHSSWNFNMNMDAPTITPSLNITWGKLADPDFKQLESGLDDPNSSGRCHSVVSNGKIYFCSDCTHHLANQTVDLPDIE